MWGRIRRGKALLTWILDRPRAYHSLILIYIFDGRRREAERRFGTLKYSDIDPCPLLSRSITEIDMPHPSEYYHLSITKAIWASCR